MKAMRNQLEMASDAAVSLRNVVDLDSAMRLAIDVVDPRDLTFLKALLYRYRDDPTSITLRVSHGQPRTRGEPPAAIGFIAQPRRGEPEAHICSSVGGVALAGYVDEITRSKSNAEALGALTKALNRCLAEAPA